MLHFTSHPTPNTLVHPPSGSIDIGWILSEQLDSGNPLSFCEGDLPKDTQRSSGRIRTRSRISQTLIKGSLPHHTTICLPIPRPAHQFTFPGLQTPPGIRTNFLPAPGKTQIKYGTHLHFLILPQQSNWSLSLIYSIL